MSKNISIDELYQELEKIRGSVCFSGEFNEEQKAFLRKARCNERPIPYSIIQRLWVKKWGNIAETTLKNRFEKMEKKK